MNMSVKSHYFTLKHSQNLHSKSTQESADATKMEESSPKDVTTVMTELQGIKTILDSLTTYPDISGGKRGIEVGIERVKSLGCRITQAKSRISKLEGKEAKRAYGE